MNIDALLTLFAAYWIFGLLIAFVPWIIASCRGHNNSTSCGILGIFLTPTIIGLIIIYVWAVFGETEDEFYLRLKNKNG